MISCPYLRRESFAVKSISKIAELIPDFPPKWGRGEATRVGTGENILGKVWDIK